jgi:hypothetical protein
MLQASLDPVMRIKKRLLQWMCSPQGSYAKHLNRRADTPKERYVQSR